MNGYVQALTVARAHILSGKQRFICFALPRNEYGKFLQQEISRRLDGSRTLERWLRKNHKTHYDFVVFTVGLEVVNQKLRNTRLAWIDSLIKEFS